VIILFNWFNFSPITTAYISCGLVAILTIQQFYLLYIGERSVIDIMCAAITFIIFNLIIVRSANIIFFREYAKQSAKFEENMLELQRLHEAKIRELQRNHLEEIEFIIGEKDFAKKAEEFKKIFTEQQNNSIKEHYND